MEQCSLTGGNFKCWAISEFFIFTASSISIPSRISVAYELEAMADPQPKVLKTALSILPVASLT
jgi:hypothetical protein